MTIMNDSRDFKKEYDAFLKNVPYQTAAIDGVEVRYQYGGKDGALVLLFLLKLVPAKTEMKLLLKKSTGFLESESEKGREYGRGVYETVASDLCL